MKAKNLYINFCIIQLMLKRLYSIDIIKIFIFRYLWIMNITEIKYFIYKEDWRIVRIILDKIKILDPKYIIIN